MVLFHLLFIAALVAAGAVFALVEIQIEGASGWATSLPTWRIKNRWTRWLFGGRVLTGYHLYIHLFILILLHLPYALSLVAPHWLFEMRTLAFLILFWILEDFLWFVLNPAYGLTKFRAEHVSWHANSWWWIMPREYWIFIPVGITLYLISWTG